MFGCARQIAYLSSPFCAFVRLARPAAASLLLDAAEAEPAARAGAVAGLGLVAVFFRRLGPARSRRGRRLRRRPVRLLGRGALATGYVEEVGTPG